MGRTKRHVLLVEDDPNDEFLALRAIGRAGEDIGVEVARDGKTALACLIDDPGTDLPQVVLLDLQLPKVSGFDVLKRLREEQRTRYLPVVVLTSSDHDWDVWTAYALGANSFVRKPVGADEFMETVSGLASFWVRSNRAPNGR